MNLNEILGQIYGWQMSDQKRRDEFIKSLVDRFLGWKLPKGVRPDPYPPGHIHESFNSGTNLLTATEAEEMFNYLFPYDVDSNSAVGWTIKYIRMTQERDQALAELDKRCKDIATAKEAYRMGAHEWREQALALASVMKSAVWNYQAERKDGSIVNVDYASVEKALAAFTAFQAKQNGS